jgi:spectinomycin phosphotransferase
MYAEPPDIDRRAVAATLEATWGLRIAELHYEPVGFGSHHYIARDASDARWFVTVDDLATGSYAAHNPESAFATLDAALRTAVALRQSGLEFVHAPIVNADGALLAMAGERYAVSLFAFIDGKSNPSSEHESAEERRAVLQALGQLHAVQLTAAAEALLRRDTLEVPLRARLADYLDNLHAPWHGGPYSEPARRLLSSGRGGIQELFARYDALAAVARASSDPWVITHGEPHGANVIKTSDGAIFLIDWDTVALAPRERDLWMVEPQDAGDWAAYTSARPADRPSPEALETYRLWWRLAEIAEYTETFQSPHEDDANTQEAWQEFQSYVPAAEPR